MFFCAKIFFLIVKIRRKNNLPKNIPYHNFFGNTQKKIKTEFFSSSISSQKNNKICPLIFSSHNKVFDLKSYQKIKSKKYLNQNLNKNLIQIWFL